MKIRAYAIISLIFAIPYTGLCAFGIMFLIGDFGSFYPLLSFVFGVYSFWHLFFNAIEQSNIFERRFYLYQLGMIQAAIYLAVYVNGFEEVLFFIGSILPIIFINMYQYEKVNNKSKKDALSRNSP